MTAPKIAVDYCGVERISGWVDRNGPVSSIEIFLDNAWLGSVAPIQFRRDLKKLGFGDGKRGFSFPLQGYLPDGGVSVISLKIDSETVYRRAIGEVDPTERPTGSQVLFEMSQERWRGEEQDAHLTWGRVMDGAALWDIYSAVRNFTSGDRILEIGPGYGRLLRTALDRGVKFAKYTGLELSKARTSRLKAEFESEKIDFYFGDANTWRGNESFDVVLCSSTFEHLYPDCSQTLRNLSQQITAEATLLIDFIEVDTPHAAFDRSGAYVRRYDEAELRQLFREAGISVSSIQRCVIGEAEHGVVARSLVVARNASARGHRTEST